MYYAIYTDKSDIDNPYSIFVLRYSTKENRKADNEFIMSMLAEFTRYIFFDDMELPDYVKSNGAKIIDGDENLMAWGE